MKFSRLFILAAAFAVVCALSGGVAKADGVDPKSGLGGGGSCASFSEGSLTETFHITNFDCTVDFQNVTNTTIVALSVVFPVQFATTLSCVIDSFQGSDGTFSNPPFNTAQTNANVCNYSGAGPLPDAQGTAPGQIAPAVCGDGCSGGIYSMQFGYAGADFSDADKATGIDITVIATPMPEPASLILMGTGLAALALRRKRLEVSAKSVA